MVETTEYVLGHSEAELERLATQARLIDPVTRRFLSAAGISDGMTVLDVGSGAGDVAMLLGSLVGPRGRVVGMDIASAAVAAATRRVQAHGLSNIEFRQGDPAETILKEQFDAVAGRYVLQFIADPAATLSRLARHVRPGGIVVFHELDWSGARSAPRVPTYDLACSWASRTIELGLADAHIGPRLARLFEGAGLAPVSMRLESVIASGNAARDIIHLVTDLIATLLPTMESLGVVSAAEVDVTTLAARIAVEVGAEAALIGRSEIAAWARVQ